MEASQSRVQDNTADADATYTDTPVIDRELSSKFKFQYGKIGNKMTVKKLDSNQFRHALRLFKVPATATLGFPPIQYLRQQFSQVICALYIFKLHHPHKDGYTHGVHLKINGFIHRRIFDTFVEQIIKEFTGEYIELRRMVPNISRSISLYDYLFSLYVLPKNLLVNFAHHLDAIAENQVGRQVDNSATSRLKQKMQAATGQIFDNMIAMPAKYPDSYISHLLVMHPVQFRAHFRATNLQEVILRVGQDAYNIALQDKRFKAAEVQELMEPMTMRSMLNRCIGGNTGTKQVQQLLQSTFDTSFVHPHPYNGLVKSDLFKLRPLDGIIFDPHFLFVLLLTARWFARACMLQECRTTNNHAHLLLYGGAGTGKTLIVSSIASAIPTYKFLTGAHFQNPDVLQSSLIAIDEFNTGELPSNFYKQLLDLKTAMKMDFKGINPENVSEGVPCMMTSNDELYTRLRTQQKFGANSVDAAIRRVYAIPVKGEQFEKLHGRIPKDSPHYNLLMGFDTRFDLETDKLQRIFNLVLAFALFQEDTRGMYFDQRLHVYFSKLVKDFGNTAFGTFYLTQKARVDEIIQDVEQFMMGGEVDDSPYIVRMASGVGQFQQLMKQFIAELAEKNSELDMSVIKDRSVPWPVRSYYILSSMKFNVRLMWQRDEPVEYFLNREVREFLANPNIQPYRTTDDVHDMFNAEQAYNDLQVSYDSSQDEKDPFNSPIPFVEDPPEFELDIDSMLLPSQPVLVGSKRLNSQREG